MYTRFALLDLHERVHRSFAGLIGHCSGLSEEELSRELEGFGLTSIRSQLHHMIGAERYWVGVLEGRMLTGEDPADAASVEALEALRRRVADVTIEYLRRTSEESLNARRAMTTWGGRDRELVAAHVIVRTQTHVFQHQGQVAAMSRLLGHPVPSGLDFPLD